MARGVPCGIAQIVDVRATVKGSEIGDKTSEHHRSRARLGCALVSLAAPPWQADRMSLPIQFLARLLASFGFLASRTSVVLVTMKQHPGTGRDGEFLSSRAGLVRSKGRV